MSSEIDKNLCNFKEVDYDNDRGQTYKEYQLNSNAFTLLVMGYTGEKALSFKLKYISLFNEMHFELAGVRQMRLFGIVQKKELTKAIQNNLHKIGDDFIYARITNCCYQKVFGKTFKQLKEFYKVKDIEGLRNFINEDALDNVARFETKVAVWIEDFGLNEGQIRQKLMT